MWQAGFSAAIIVAAISNSSAAFARESQGNVHLQASFEPRGGCRVMLTRYINVRPYEARPRPFRLPSAQRRLVNALRDSGAERHSASIHSAANVPEDCFAAILAAVRAADFRQIGFSAPAEPERPIDRISVCDVAADPMRFRGRRIEIRGPVNTSMTPDGIHHSMIDTDCRAGVRLTDRNSEFWRPLLGVGRDQVVTMTVIGTAAVSTCYRIPPGSMCGTQFVVERFADVEPSSLCWAYRPIDRTRSELVTRPCPAEATR